MSKIIVKDGDLNFALKKFTRVTSETKKIMKNHEFYLRPGLKAKEKSKNAQRRKFK